MYHCSLDGVLAQVKNGNKQLRRLNMHSIGLSFIFVFGFWVMGQSKWLLPNQKKMKKLKLYVPTQLINRSNNMYY
jgi:hypothetical protein